MSRITILTEEERQKYDSPPLLSLDEKENYFMLTEPLKNKINRLHTATNKVCFLLQYGYFTATQRFFDVDDFLQDDINYIANLINVSQDEIDLPKYKTNMVNLHKKSILKIQDFKPFDEKSLSWFNHEVIRQVSRFTQPNQIFLELLHLLDQHTIERPSYHRLSELISQHYNDYEMKQLNVIQQEVPKDLKPQLDHLLHADTARSPGLLNQLKYINQSKEPKAIKASVEIFKQVADLFNPLHNVIAQLSLTPQCIEYYAIWVKKAKLSQLKQFPEQDKIYLHLIAFLQHQYYLRQDSFVDIFLKSVQTIINTAKIRLEASDRLTRGERRAAVHHLTHNNKNYKELVNAIKQTTQSSVLTASGKVDEITRILEQHEKESNEVSQEKLDKLEKSLADMVKDNDYYNILEKLSIRLQNRISSILKVLDFNENSSNSDLLKVVQYYKEHNGNINQDAPIDILSDQEKAVIRNTDGRIRVSLYKVLLFIHVADAIKSGQLNLQHSYRYLSINDYLIQKETWEKDREHLLELTGLNQFSDFSCIMSELKECLNEKYDAVNQRFIEGRNPYLSINDQGVVHVKTPAIEDKKTEHITAFLSHVNYIPIFDVLSDVNQVVGFVDCFKHHAVKNVKQQPKEQDISAGIIGLGCNIGIPKISHISAGITQNTLKNTVNWCFSLKNIITANHRVISVIDKLSLPNVFVMDKQNRHGSSDGRKMHVAVDCLLANKSFKYFGKDSGVSIYTFIDERQVLFYSTVISASEREAAFVIDGLNHNDVVKIDIHSTDSHGYMESIFATTHFFEISFAPRLKNIGKQRIYAFSSKSTYEKKGCPILPSRTIRLNLIEPYWDDVLRFMATIKLKEVSASQLFKRLSSYAKDHPLYKAIKEFGRIIKSIFILTYYDDVTLRQRIEKQLNRIELSNKFGRAVFYANNGEFKQATTEEQQIITACTVLIQNAIVLWNYLYLSKLLMNCEEQKERDHVIQLIRDGCILVWAHINLHGEFNFSRKAANEPYFNLNKILKLVI